MPNAMECQFMASEKYLVEVSMFTTLMELLP